MNHRQLNSIMATYKQMQNLYKMFSTYIVKMTENPQSCCVAVYKELQPMSLYVGLSPTSPHDRNNSLNVANKVTITKISMTVFYVIYQPDWNSHSCRNEVLTSTQLVFYNIKTL